MASLARRATFSSATRQPRAVPVPGIVHHAKTRILCFATPEQQTPPPQPLEQPPTQPQPQASADGKPLILQQGQGTAIITGAISIVFGVAYLALVLLMDWRGGEMLPPPPEAFGP
jgi:hypothetical protein